MKTIKNLLFALLTIWWIKDQHKHSLSSISVVVCCFFQTQHELELESKKVKSKKRQLHQILKLSRAQT